MRRERCPRCGGELDLDHESWSRGARSLERGFVCRACGESFAGHVRWPSARPPSALSRGSGRAVAGALAWVVVGLVVLWLVLRTLGYVGRADLYRTLSAVGEMFMHPATAAVLVIAAAALFLLGRRSTLTSTLPAAVAPEVHLRAEPPGRLSVVLTGSRDALARDFVLERAPEAEERILERFGAIARRTLDFAASRATGDGWTRSEIEEAQREIYSLGLAIGNELMGESGEVADAMADLPGDHLQLAVQAELAAVPWELMVPRPGGRFLWQLFSVSRQLRDSVSPAVQREPGDGPLRVLLLANPETGTSQRGLPAAEREASELMELGARRPDLLRIVRKSPVSGPELRALLGEGFDVLHFAGHSDAGNGARGRWVLGGGTVVDPAEEVRRSGTPPLFVFANACSSSPGSGVDSTADSARALMRAGVRAYLCTLWELHDSGSAAFSGAFYRAALDSTLGSAVTSARSALLGAHPMTWANYVLYGDPALRLLRSR